MEPAERPPTLAGAWACFAAGDRPAAIAQVRMLLQADEGQADALAHAALAYFLIDAGLLQEAGAVLSPALARWPGHAVLHWYAGLLRQREGAADAAIAALRTACTLDPQLDEAAFALAWLLHDSGEPEEAMRWCGHALGLRRSAERLLQAGWLEQAVGRYDAAATLYREALTLREAAPRVLARAHLHLGECLSRLGRDGDAMQALAAGLQAHPDDADLLLAYGEGLRGRGRHRDAAELAQRVVRRDPADVRAWDLLALAQEGLGDPAASASATERSLQLQPGRAGPLARLAELRRRQGRMDDAMALAGQALAADPGHPGARELHVHLLLERRDAAAARRALLPWLRRAPAQPEALRLLAVAASLRGRRRAARRWLVRSTRLAGDRPETWRTLAWIEAELGHVEAAVEAVTRLLAMAPAEEVAARLQGALILARGGRLAAAERLAEDLLAVDPQLPDAWRALAEVRYFQRRWRDAQWAIGQAIALQPGAAQHWRRLAWAHMELGEFTAARAAWEQARACQPDEPDILVEMGELGLRAGEGLATLSRLQGARAGHPAARLLRVRLLVQGGQHDAGDPVAAMDLCRALLADQPDDPAVLRVVCRALALGHAGAEHLLDAASPTPRLAALREAIASTVHLHGHEPMRRLVEHARRWEPDDTWLQCAALYFAWMDAGSTPTQLAAQARAWSRTLGAGPLQPPVAKAMPRRTERPRIAYLATQPHQGLLRRVLAAHAQGEIDVLLFSDESWPELPPNVRLRPVALDRLAATCAANAVELVVDTGGLHPLGSLDPQQGQFGLLQLLGRRIAPCQVGWLGTWGSSGGLFDVLLADDWSVPPQQRAAYTEVIVSLEGGQWCWDPPAAAPDVAGLPALRNGRITFGVIARHVRLNDLSLQAIAQVLQRVPDACLVFLGRLGADWPARRDVLALLASAGIVTERVRFEPHSDHARFLASMQQIDLVLDTFPGSGGLSLLDALWMGVPVVTLAGDWLGARQGASLLMTVGRPEWVAGTTEGYVQIAVQLAQDAAGLAALRAGLREQVRTSPLLDGARVARQIEALARRYRPA